MNSQNLSQEALIILAKGAGVKPEIIKRFKTFSHEQAQQALSKINESIKQFLVNCE